MNSEYEVKIVMDPFTKMLFAEWPDGSWSPIKADPRSGYLYAEVEDE